MPSPLSRRVRLARQHGEYETPSTLAARMSEFTGQSVPTSHIESLESGRATASGHLVHLAIACRVRPEWLMMGEEPMTSDGIVSDLAEVSSDLRDDQRRLLRGYEAASPKLKKAFLRFADFVELSMRDSYKGFIDQRELESRWNTEDEYKKPGKTQGG